MSDDRHRVGTIYSCDARNFGADRRLCPVHQQAEPMLTLIKDVLDYLDRLANHHTTSVNEFLDETGFTARAAEIVRACREPLAKERA
jgi:hypothetical protein